MNWIALGWMLRIFWLLLQAKGTMEGFGGDFMVPSYRGSSFLDPKVRSHQEPTELKLLIHIMPVHCC